MALTLTSSAYNEGHSMPAKYTCQGEGVSPPFAWSGIPRGTKAFAFILDDPDAPGGTWTHWTFWNLSAGVKGLPEGADVADLGAVPGNTSTGHTGYHGPCPPAGTHRYIAKLYALSSPLTLPEGSPVTRLRAAMIGRVLAEAHLGGTFSKS